MCDRDGVCVFAVGGDGHSEPCLEGAGDPQETQRRCQHMSQVSQATGSSKREASIEPHRVTTPTYCLTDSVVSRLLQVRLTISHSHLYITLLLATVNSCKQHCCLVLPRVCWALCYLPCTCVCRCLHQDSPALEVGNLYWQLKDSVARYELLLLRALKFQLYVKLPHPVSRVHHMTHSPHQYVRALSSLAYMYMYMYLFTCILYSIGYR